MKVQPISDMHVEMGLIDGIYKKVVKTDADVLVLAGDIGSHNDIIESLIRMHHHAEKPVVFVPGNHEYYGTSRAKLDILFDELNEDYPNIHVLTEKAVKIGDVWFVGSTGWWDGSGGNIGQTVRFGLNDFRMIKELAWAESSAQWGIAWGREARIFFDQTLAKIRKDEGEDAKIVCVSHHYPHMNSLHPDFAGSPLNACFGNRWEWLIEKHHPTMWIHGHTHKAFDYWVKHEGHDTHMVCNPHGYPKEYAPNKSQIKKHFDKHYMGIDESTMSIYTLTENEEFDPNMVVEI